MSKITNSRSKLGCQVSTSYLINQEAKTKNYEFEAKLHGAFQGRPIYKVNY